MTNARQEEGAGEAVHAARATHDAALLLMASASDTARVAALMVRKELAERPYVALGVAASVGFVVAGGLVTPAVRGLARIGMRFALATAIRKLGDALLEPEAAAPSATAAATPTATPQAAATAAAE